MDVYDDKNGGRIIVLKAENYAIQKQDYTFVLIAIDAQRITLGEEDTPIGATNIRDYNKRTSLSIKLILSSIASVYKAKIIDFIITTNLIGIQNKLKELDLIVDPIFIAN